MDKTKFTKEKRHVNTITLLLLIWVVCNLSCKKQPSEPINVYSNDFEAGNLQNIQGGTIENYNGTHVLGRYNKGAFELTLNNLPAHNLLSVSFNLYIHDSWDGNESYGENYVGPDFWTMLIDYQTYIYTTFGNNLGAIPGARYPVQSYPNTYPATNLPRTGSYAYLPGACSLANQPTGTTLYKITKTINHTSSTFDLKCFDGLQEKGIADQKCDESWSIDNLVITVAK